MLLTGKYSITGVGLNNIWKLKLIVSGWKIALRSGNI